MQPAKVRIAVFFFCYGGNGGVSSIIPEIALWWGETLLKIKADPRIEGVMPIILSDTPITMTRNRAVETARANGCDMILMLDSDNEPDGYLQSDPTAKPFWETAFDFAYERLTAGIPTVIAAPYCGPPPHPTPRPGVIDGGEVPYLFEWQNNESDVPVSELRLDQWKLEILKRNEAARLKGIYPVAALPTGCCLFTTNAFEGLPQPYFRYEFDDTGANKLSTEDVVATRDISLYWKMTKNIDVLFATCDSWALHYKPKKVGRPTFTPVEATSKLLRDSIVQNQSAFESMRNLSLEIPDGCHSYDGPANHQR
jgi:hypothetical protein